MQEATVSDAEKIARDYAEMLTDDPRKAQDIVAGMRSAYSAGYAAAREQAAWKKMTAADLRALPPNGSFPALMYDPDLDHIGLPCDPWSLPVEDIEACWFMPVPPKPEPNT